MQYIFFCPDLFYSKHANAQVLVSLADIFSETILVAVILVIL